MCLPSYFYDTIELHKAVFRRRLVDCCRSIEKTQINFSRSNFRRVGCLPRVTQQHLGLQQPVQHHLVQLKALCNQVLFVASQRATVAGKKYKQSPFILVCPEWNQTNFLFCRKSSLASRPSTGAARNAQSSAFKARHAQRAALLQAKAVAKSDADARAEVKQVRSQMPPRAPLPIFTQLYTG